MKNRDFKYKATFPSNLIYASTDVEFLNISNASAEHLGGLIPEDIDLQKNIDLIAVAFDAAVVNDFNKNGDGIASSAAMSIKDLFIHKPCNIEHQKEKIVGHVVSAGFSQFGEGQEFIEVSADDTDLFNISLGAVVYKTVAPEFADMVLESSDPESESYQDVSASWEIGFNEYAIAIGPNVANAEIITDPEEVDSLSSNLKSFGGSGMLEDGRPINRLIVGEIYPLGIGFTNNPAANVKGLMVKKIDKRETLLDKQDKRQDNIVEEKSSLLKSETVIQSEETFFLNTMEKQELLKDIEQLLSEKAAAKDFSDEAIANITKVFHDAIREKSQEYVEQVEQAKAEKSEAESKNEELQQTLSDFQNKLDQTEQKLQALEDEKLLAQTQAAFDSRMTCVEDLYELEDEDRKVIASELSELSLEEEAFAAYQEKLAVVFKSKSKEYLAKLAEEMEAKINQEVEKRLAAQASQEDSEEVVEGVEETLEKAEAEEVSLPNNNCETAESEEDLRERFQKAFKDSVKIQF
ncbi:MAG: hypothetical protein ACR2ON_00425 [Paracoccaceae bacterium]